MVDTVESLRAELAAAREALRHYAPRCEGHGCGGHATAEVAYDGRAPWLVCRPVDPADVVRELPHADALRAALEPET
jgi:hypothetical protein